MEVRGEREGEGGRGKEGRRDGLRERVCEGDLYLSRVCLLYTLSYSCGDGVAGLCSLCVHGDYEPLNPSTNLLGG